MPKVSVVIPSYNSERVVSKTVESALNQTFTDIEIIVVDDGSTDNTCQVLAPFKEHIHYIYQENRKHSGARNTGIRAATGDYLAFLDSDDIWLPEKIEKQVAVLDADPQIVLVCCPAKFIDLDGQPVISRGRDGDDNPDHDLKTGNWTKLLFLGDAVPGGGSSAMVRRDALLRAGMFDEQIDYGEDWDTWLRLSFQGLFAYIPDPLVKFRVSDWERVLRREASNELMAHPLRMLEKACALWQGDPVELGVLNQQALGMLWLRAALASFQLGIPEQGRDQFSRALSYWPQWIHRQLILDFAVDRAKLIRVERNDYSFGISFLHTYFTHLPEQLVSFSGLEGEAVSWLWLSGVREKMESGDYHLAKSYWHNAWHFWPWMLLNRGVLSLGKTLWLGDGYSS